MIGEPGLREENEDTTISGVEGMPERVAVCDYWCRFFCGRLHRFALTSRSHVGIILGEAWKSGGDNLQPSDFYLGIQIFLAVAAAIVVVGGFMRWANQQLEQRIVKEIKDSTYQIQPGTNGGASLSDLHSKIDCLLRDVSMLKSSVLRLENEVRTLEDDVEELR